MPDIEQIHNKFFQEVLSETANASTFLKFVLPEAVQQRLDLSAITFDPTTYISEEYKSSFSDLVVKCRTKTEQLPVEVYCLLEHKSFQDHDVLLQLLRYKYMMWRKDRKDKKPLRVIIALVFYHGEGKWQVPTQFIEQFPRVDEFKPYLLNFAYILFDTNAWDWQAESSRPLRENVYLLSAMMLMKAAFNKDLQLVRQVFQLWAQMDFSHEKKRIDFLLIYVMETQDTPIIELEKMLEETRLQGEIVMPTLAQRLRDEGMQQGVQHGMQQALLMQLSTRFQLAEDEKQFIGKIAELEKLTTALKLVVTAQTKEEVLQSLQGVVH
jgi:predicted transposase/invertase (TIGR01784 family)